MRVHDKERAPRSPRRWERSSRGLSEIQFLEALIEALRRHTCGHNDCLDIGKKWCFDRAALRCRMRWVGTSRTTEVKAHACKKELARHFASKLKARAGILALSAFSSLFGMYKLQMLLGQAGSDPVSGHHTKHLWDLAQNTQPKHNPSSLRGADETGVWVDYPLLRGNKIVDNSLVREALR